MEASNKLSQEDIHEITTFTDMLSTLESELVPVDTDEISALMQTSDDDVLVEGRITEFHEVDQVLQKNSSGPNKTISLAKHKQKRKNKQKQANKSRKQNR